MHVNNIITSTILSSFPRLIHGISTKAGGEGKSTFFNNMSFKVGDAEANVKANRDKFFGSLGIDPKRLGIPQQVHSDEVKIIDKPGYYSGCDGLITETPDVYLIISTADCFSVLIFDRAHRAIGNIHSGWRGTQKKIVSKAVELMMRELGSKNDDLIVFIGPGISRNNFEVGGEVAEMFDGRFVVKQNGKYFVDLKQHIVDQLSSLGIVNKQIEAYKACTFESEDYLHSYRRDREKSGRMFSVIGMKK